MVSPMDAKQQVEGLLSNVVWRDAAGRAAVLIVDDNATVAPFCRVTFDGGDAADPSFARALVTVLVFTEYGDSPQRIASAVCSALTGAPNRYLLRATTDVTPVPTGPVVNPSWSVLAMTFATPTAWLIADA